MLSMDGLIAVFIYVLIVFNVTGSGECEGELGGKLRQEEEEKRGEKEDV